MAQKKQKKVIKKKFFPVSVPILKKEIELLGDDIQSLDKRTIKLDLTHDLKGRAIDLKLIVSANEKEATSSPIELKLSQSYMKRMVRKGTDYSEDSIKANCKDQKVIIKPFMITRKRVTKAVLKGLRENAKKEIISWLAKKNFEDAIEEIIIGKLQKEIQPKLKKVYPLSLFEIKFLGLGKKDEYQEPEMKTKKVKIEEDDNTTNISSN